MDGVGTPIIGRPRPLPGHDTPDTAHNTYTLNYEEPVILDLTPIRERSGPCRLLDMVPGRSKQVFKTWLASRPDTWRSRIEIVAMDGFTGFKSAAAEELPDARAVMDPFHVVHLGRGCFR